MDSKAYIVKKVYPYEGSSVLGVFTTLEPAKEAMYRLAIEDLENWRHYYTVQRPELLRGEWYPSEVSDFFAVYSYVTDILDVDAKVEASTYLKTLEEVKDERSQ